MPILIYVTIVILLRYTINTRNFMIAWTLEIFHKASPKVRRDQGKKGPLDEC